MYEVRFIDISDVEWLIEVAIPQTAKEVEREDLFDAPRSLMLINEIKRDGIGLILLKRGRRIGCIGGVITPHPYNNNVLTLTKLLWFVSREERLSKAVLLLKNRFLEEGKKRDVDEIVFGIPVKSNINQSLMRDGFVKTEEIYTWRKGDE